MSGLFGAVIGLLGAVGFWLIIAGIRRSPTRVQAPPRARSSSVTWRVALLAATAFVVVWAVSGWPAGGLMAAAAVAVMPVLREARHRRADADERSEALASWSEMLRDTISAHAGLREAIALTAPVAPLAIRAHVQALAVHAEREPLADALRSFARDLADPVGDLIVASLVLAADRQAQRLAELLSRIASAAREQTTMRQRIEVGRARTYASSRALVAITLVLAVGLLVFSPRFMAPYRSMTGQFVLMGIGVVFGGALVGLVAMSRPAPVPRLLLGVEAVAEGVKR